MTIIDNNLINNRPKELLDIEYYTELPKTSVVFNYESLPEFLNIDLYTLFGIMPKTKDLVDKTGIKYFSSKLTDEEIEYYRNRNTKFQIINVVANIHTSKKVENEDVFTAYPYSISIVAGPKRGIPDEASIDLLKCFNFEKISNSQPVFTDFSPFKAIETGFYSPVNFLSDKSIKQYTDTIGFVLETYFLPTDIDLEDIPMHGPQNLDSKIIQKYNKYRIKRYFKPFTDIKPRRIWGCDSPIELFLVQGLSKRNIFPKIQTLIFKDGSVFDNYYQMVQNQIFIKGDELITEVDFYFSNEKLAIFCDSQQYHRGNSNKNKDRSIDNRLFDLGIRSLRLNGKDIVDNLNVCIEQIIKELALRP